MRDVSAWPIDPVGETPHTGGAHVTMRKTFAVFLLAACAIGAAASTSFADSMPEPISIEDAGQRYLQRNPAPLEIEEDWNGWVNDAGTAIWDRPGLGRAERSLVTIGILSVLREEGPLRVHVEAGLANGLTRRQISEAIMHTALYAGVPQALRSMSIAREVFDRLDAAAVDPDPAGGTR